MSSRVLSLLKQKFEHLRGMHACSGDPNEGQILGGISFESLCCIDVLNKLFLLFRKSLCSNFQRYELLFCSKQDCFFNC